MESENTQNAEECHERMTCDHDVCHLGMDSYGDELKDGVYEAVTSSVEESDSDVLVEMPADDVSEEDVMSHVCEDLSSVFNHMNSSQPEETFTLHDSDVSDEEWCYCDLNVRPASQQVARHCHEWTRLLFAHLFTDFSLSLRHVVGVVTSLFFTSCCLFSTFS